MVTVVAYVVSGIGFLAEFYLVPKWVRQNWWLIKHYPELLWRSLRG